MAGRFEPPRVTVLLPVRNAAPFLDRALGSVWRQTFRSLEVVVVDDGSTDRTPDILARHAARDNRLRRVPAGPESGLVAALNQGLAEARGTYLARFDADDLCHARRLEAQVGLLRANPHVVVAGCQVASFPRRTLGLGYRLYDAWANGILTPEAHWRERYVESTLPHPSAMMRTEELLALGGYRQGAWPEDLDLWLRVHASGGALQKVPEVLYYWRDHPGRASRIDARYSRAAFVRLKAHHLAHDPWRAGRDVVIWGTGPIGRQFGRGLREEGVPVVAYVDVDPAKIGRSRGGVSVIAPRDLPRFSSVAVLAAVGARGARQLIRGQLTGLGYVEGRDFLAVA
jgi:glycosyltransferase involved in cell wall biosynthesis